MGRGQKDLEMDLERGINSFFRAIDDTCQEAWRKVRPLSRLILTEQDKDGLFQAQIDRRGKLLTLDAIDVHNRDFLKGFDKATCDLFKDISIECYLSPRNFFFHQFSFPTKLSSIADKLVLSQIDQYMPWPEDRIVFGRSDIVVGSIDSSLVVAAAERSYVECLVEILRHNFRCNLNIYAICDSDESVRIPLSINAASHASTSRRMTSKFVFSGMACFIVLLNFSAWWKSTSLDQSIESLTKEIVQHGSNLSRQANVAIPGETIALSKKFAERTLSFLLDDLSRLLPDHTWLVGLDYSDGTFVLDGFSKDPPSLIKILENSAHFSHAEFAGPTEKDRETGVERFKIRVAIKRYLDIKKADRT